MEVPVTPIWIILTAIPAVCVLAVAVWFFITYLVRPNRPPELAEAAGTQYQRDLPSDLPPAMAGMLFDNWASAEKASATVLDLVRRGVVRLTRVPSTGMGGGRVDGDELWITLERDKVRGLWPFETYLLQLLFDFIGRGEPSLRVSWLRQWWKRFPQSSTMLINRWGQWLRHDATAAGLMPERPDRVKKNAQFFGIGVCLVGVLGGMIWFAWVPAFFMVGVTMAMYASGLGQLTPRGTELWARYEGLRRYLADFGRFAEKPPEAVALWDEYLPLAVVFGLATESMAELFVTPVLPSSRDPKDAVSILSPDFAADFKLRQQMLKDEMATQQPTWRVGPVKGYGNSSLMNPGGDQTGWGRPGEPSVARTVPQIARRLWPLFAFWAVWTGGIMASAIWG